MTHSINAGFDYKNKGCVFIDKDCVYKNKGFVYKKQRQKYTYIAKKEIVKMREVAYATIFQKRHKNQTVSHTPTGNAEDLPESTGLQPVFGTSTTGIHSLNPTRNQVKHGRKAML